MAEIKPGRYKHYKGGEYLLIGEAHHSETLEPMVVYQAMYDMEDFGPKPIWVRPKTLFIDSVEFEGKTVPRFEYIGE